MLLGPTQPGLLMSGLLEGKCVSNQQVKTHRRGAVLLIMAEIKLFAADEQIKTWELIPITAALKHAGGRMKFIFVLKRLCMCVCVSVLHGSTYSTCVLCAFTWVANSTGLIQIMAFFDATVVGTTVELRV